MSYTTKLKQIVRYYNATQEKYGKFWMSDKNLAMHLGFWDKNVKSHGYSLIRMNETLAGLVKVKKTDLILDAGCGVGGSSIWLARNFGARVIGITLVDMQVKMAREFAKKNRVNHLTEFKKMDFMNTTFDEETFDVVWAQESVCYAPDKQRCADEMHRILKRDGRLIIGDAFIKKGRLTESEHKSMLWIHGYEVPNLAKINQFMEYLDNAGFRQIRFRNVTRNVMPSSKKLYFIGKLAGPSVFPLASRGGKYGIWARNLKSSILQYETLKDGLWCHGIFCAVK